jgi:hypothetical protein
MRRWELSHEPEGHNTRTHDEPLIAIEIGLQGTVQHVRQTGVRIAPPKMLPRHALRGVIECSGKAPLTVARRGVVGGSAELSDTGANSVALRLVGIGTASPSSSFHASSLRMSAKLTPPSANSSSSNSVLLSSLEVASSGATAAVVLVAGVDSTGVLASMRIGAGLVAAGVSENSGTGGTILRWLLGVGEAASSLIDGANTSALCRVSAIEVERDILRLLDDAAACSGLMGVACRAAVAALWLSFAAFSLPPPAVTDATALVDPARRVRPPFSLNSLNSVSVLVVELL